MSWGRAVLLGLTAAAQAERGDFAQAKGMPVPLTYILGRWCLFVQLQTPFWQYASPCLGTATHRLAYGPWCCTLPVCHLQPQT